MPASWVGFYSLIIVSERLKKRKEKAIGAKKGLCIVKLNRTGASTTQGNYGENRREALEKGNYELLARQCHGVETWALRHFGITSEVLWARWEQPSTLKLGGRSKCRTRV